jgi:hypothetical protein
VASDVLIDWVLVLLNVICLGGVIAITIDPELLYRLAHFVRAL